MSKAGLTQACEVDMRACGPQDSLGAALRGPCQACSRWWLRPPVPSTPACWALTVPSLTLLPKGHLESLANAHATRRM